MKELFVNYLIDCSDRKFEQYALICSVCGKEWRSTPVAVSEIGSSADQKRRSAAEAAGLMDVCPLCGDIVCSDCIVSVDNLFMCRTCAGRMPAECGNAAVSETEIPTKKMQMQRLPFDSLRFAIIPCMNYWMDGNRGERTIFISDERETVQISFEEGMQFLDLSKDEAFRCVKYRKGNRYLHQASVERTARIGAQKVIFFHVEITDTKNRTYGLPGQMITGRKNTEENTVDPILIELLNSITLVNEETYECM